MLQHKLGFIPVIYHFSTQSNSMELSTENSNMNLITNLSTSIHTGKRSDKPTSPPTPKSFHSCHPYAKAQ